MRIVSSLLALALAMPAVYGEATAIIEEMEPHDVELEAVVAKPTAFLGMRVRFQATFVQTSDLFDTFHTGFTPSRFLNLVLWDDEADIWVPEVRSAPLTSVFYEKRRDGANEISTLESYTLVEITGEVVSDFRGQPWINCHMVEPQTQLGRLTANGVYHIERATELAESGNYELADEHYAKAMEVNVPNFTKVTLQQLRAENLMASGEWERSADVLQKALAGVSDNISDERHARLHFLRAKSLSELAQQTVLDGEDGRWLFESAVGHAEKAVAIHPELGDAYAVLGISLAGLKRFDDAKNQCQRAIFMLPENAEVRWYLGRILNIEESYSEAIDVLRDAIDLAPKDYRLHKTIALSYFERGKLGGSGASEDVVSALREDDIALRLESTDPDLHYHAGLVIEHAVERDQQIRVGLKMVDATYDQAIERFEACLVVDDTYTDAHVRLGYRYREKGEDAKAVDHFKRALELEPERDELYAMLGDYLWDLERREEAYEVYLQHVDRKPDHINTLYALGRLSLELDEDQRAVNWLNTLLRLSPQHALAHADLTESYYEVGNYREVLAHADQAIALLSTDDEEEAAQAIRVHRFAGIAAWGLDNVERALAELTEHGPTSDDPRVLLATGWALTTTADLDAALAVANKAVKVEVEGAQELLAWVTYLKGDYQAAEKGLQALYASDDKNDVLAYRLGMALFQMGSSRFADAKPLLEQASRLSTRMSILNTARSEVKTALRAIRDYEKDQERAARDRSREQAKAQEAARKAAEEARKAAKREQQ